MAPEGSQRLYSVDVIKGVIIFLIMFLHVAVASKDNMGETPVYEQYLYLGLMAFFIISGYFYRPDRGILANITKRTKQIVVATVAAGFVLTTLIYIWLIIWGQDPGLGDYWESTLQYLGLGYVGLPGTEQMDYAISFGSIGYYFLWTMLTGFLIFYPIADRVYKDPRLGAVAILALLLVTVFLRECFCWALPFFAQLAPLAASFMIAGIYLAQNKSIENIEKLDVRNPMYWLPLIICIVISVVMVFVFPPGTNFDLLIFGDYGGYSVFPYFVEALTVFVIIVYFATFLSKVPVISRIFNALGQHTLGLLLLHGGVAKLMAIPFCTITTVALIPNELGFPVKAVLAFITMAVCMAILTLGPKLVAMIREKAGKS